MDSDSEFTKYVSTVAKVTTYKVANEGYTYSRRKVDVQGKGDTLSDYYYCDERLYIYTFTALRKEQLKTENALAKCNAGASFKLQKKKYRRYNHKLMDFCSGYTKSTQRVSHFYKWINNVVKLIPLDIT
jgi:hypothetical protein